MSHTPLQCINCGIKGHTSKRCNFPVTSYGIICFVRPPRPSPPHVQYAPHKFVMIQRKDSLSYIEFMRGKYSLANREYLLKMFTNMTVYERKRIWTLPFDVLWSELWFDNARKKQNNDYRASFAKFDKISQGYLLRTQQGEKICINMQYFQTHFAQMDPASHYYETEWEFPKGRRQLNESDIQCALREFYEETNIHTSRISLLHLKPYEEVYIGSNSTRYRNIYFLAQLIHHRDVTDIGVDMRNRMQIKEVRSVNLFTMEEVMERIRTMYVERRELFMRIYHTVKNHARKSLAHHPPLHAQQQVTITYPWTPCPIRTRKEIFPKINGNGGYSGNASETSGTSGGHHPV